MRLLFAFKQKNTGAINAPATLNPKFERPSKRDALSQIL
jgi:hypothetical protein